MPPELPPRFAPVLPPPLRLLQPALCVLTLLAVPPRYAEGMPDCRCCFAPSPVLTPAFCRGGFMRAAVIFQPPEKATLFLLFFYPIFLYSLLLHCMFSPFHAHIDYGGCSVPPNPSRRVEVAHEQRRRVQICHLR